MRRLIGHAGKYILLLLMLVCFGHILSTGTLINSYGASVIYYLSDEPYTLDYVTNMKENEETLENYLPFTAVGSLDNQNFTNPDLDKTLDCQMLYIYGSSSLICSSSGELLADDLTGCILSSQAAWELFGETNITGGEVIYNDKTYYVRGVYENDALCIILPADTVLPGTGDTQEASFDKIIVKPRQNSESGNIRDEYIQAFENRWGLGSNKTDCLIYQRLTSFFMMLLPTLILIYIIIKGLRFIFFNRYRPFWMAVGIFGLAAMFLLFFIICQTTPSIPSDMIPNRWSDFEFWGDLIETFKNSIQHILFYNKSEIELSYFRPLTGLIGYTLIGLVLFFTANICFKADNWKAFFQIMAGICITEFIVIYLLCSSDLMMDSIQILLYLWPYLLTGKYLFQTDRTSIRHNESELLPGN